MKVAGYVYEPVAVPAVVQQCFDDGDGEINGDGHFNGDEETNGDDYVVMVMVILLTMVMVLVVVAVCLPRSSYALRSE